MSNFFCFEKDIDVVEYPFDPSRPFRFKAYGGTPFFSLSGYSYPGTEFLLEKAFVLPKGQYQIGLDVELKGRNDKIVLRNEENNFDIELSKEQTKITVENQMELDFILIFNSDTRYLFGDNYNEQEDYGKDYSIKVNVLSGGLYDRKTYTAVLKGDTTKDGLISMDDLLILRTHLLGGEFEEVDTFRYDLNGDGVIDAVDLMIIRRYLSGTYPLYDVEYMES